MNNVITMTYTPPFKVNLTYFKPSGKYYAEGSYNTSKLNMFEIFTEVKKAAQEGIRPGLCNCGPMENDFYILIDVPDHPHNYPHLIMPDVKE